MNNGITFALAMLARAAIDHDNDYGDRMRDAAVAGRNEYDRLRARIAELEHERDTERARHGRYLHRIAATLNHRRMRRETGEPLLSDFAEIEALAIERDEARAKLAESVPMSTVRDALEGRRTAWGYYDRRDMGSASPACDALDEVADMLGIDLDAEGGER